MFGIIWRLRGEETVWGGPPHFLETLLRFFEVSVPKRNGFKNGGKRRGARKGVPVNLY